MPLFRKPKPQPAPEPEALEAERRAEPPYVPASMRPRPAPVSPQLDGDNEGPDEEIAFLASLAEQVAREGRAPAADAPSPRRVQRTQEPEEDDDPLRAFRAQAPVSDPYEGVRKLHIDAVEMDELLDDLSMTAAALRRRRAA